MANVSLQCISGPLTGQIFRLAGRPAFIFGRYPKSHFSLAADPAASHLHFLIDTSEDRVRITDLGSTNGLVVNDTHYGGKTGTPLTDFITLVNGDIILVGSCMFRLSVEATEAATSSDTGDYRKSAIIDNLRRASGTGKFTTVIKQDDMLRTDTSSVISINADGDPDLVVPEVEEEDEMPHIEGFSIIEKIGGGGKGVVYRAIKDDTGVTAAIKMLLSSKSGKQRSIEVFRREIRVTKQLSHPNIVRYLADGIADGDPYLALEFATGGTLDELLANLPEKRMDLTQAIPLFIQILEAVAYMHGLSLVHRDIKPKNILLDLRRGGSMSPKLSDMGLSCRFSTQDVDEFFPIISDGGTPAYMPPEQLLDITKALPQSDVFSTAATFYQILTGSLLYDFSGKNHRDAIIEGNIKPILYLKPDLPLGLANVISKGLSYNPENRYNTAQEMLEALKLALD